MSKVFDKNIVIQKMDETTEKWTDLYTIHARINKAKADNKYLSSGAIQDKRSLTFEVRYFKQLEFICLNLQVYRILYQGVPYDLKDYDDYLMQHKVITFLGVSY